MQEGGTLDSDNHSSLPPVTPKSASSLGPVFIVNILAKGYVYPSQPGIICFARPISTLMLQSDIQPALY